MTGLSSQFIPNAETTAGRRRRRAVLLLLLLVLCGCRAPDKSSDKAGAGEEAIARTEFTERVENFFEYEPLKAGRPSQFLIHLTDLSDGSPVEQAEVTLTVRPEGGGAEGKETKAKVGKVTGIYVAEVAIPSPGEYSIEFRIRNAKLDEHMPLADFKVE